MLENNLDPRDFETAEYDYICAKDRFNNIKFIYKEKLGKSIFLSKLKSISDCTFDKDTINRKDNLVSVKDGNNSKDSEIYELSKLCYDLDKQLCEYDGRLNLLKNVHNKLKNEDEKLRVYCNSSENKAILNAEFDFTDNEMKNVLIEIDKLKQSLNKESLQKMLNEKIKLEQELVNLKLNVKRMTLMPSENKLEEIHNWYLSLLGVYRKLFGEFEVSFSSNKCEMTIFNKVYEYSVKLIIENNKLQQIVFINIPESMLQVYNEVREWCIRLNDPRLIMHFLTNLEGLI